jgi:hypothetical protein
MLILALMVIVALVPAVLLRWVILRRSLTTWPAGGVTLLIFFALVAVANVLSWEPSPGMGGSRDADLFYPHPTGFTHSSQAVDPRRVVLPQLN